MTTTLETAIAHARRIRKNLIRIRRDAELGGDCGLASLLLASVIGVKTLRHTTGGTTHVWNEVDGTIIDITATQFNDGFAEWDLINNPIIRGVLVTRVPRFYHLPVCGRGAATVRFLRADEWYSADKGNGYRPLRAMFERLSP